MEADYNGCLVIRLVIRLQCRACCGLWLHPGRFGIRLAVLASLYVVGAHCVARPRADSQKRPMFKCNIQSVAAL